MAAVSASGSPVSVRRVPAGIRKMRRKKREEGSRSGTLFSFHPSRGQIPADAWAKSGRSGMREKLLSWWN